MGKGFFLVLMNGKPQSGANIRGTKKVNSGISQKGSMAMSGPNTSTKLVYLIQKCPLKGEFLNDV